MSCHTSEPLRFTGFGPFRRGRIRKRYLALIVLLVLIAWAGWTVYRAVTATPGPLVDYGTRLLDLSAQMQPEGENGWPKLVQALDRLEQIGTPDRADWPTDPQRAGDIRALHRVLEGAFDTQRLAFEIEYLDFIHESGVLELLDEFAASPRSVRPAFGGDAGQGLVFVLLPELGQARAIARARAAAMRVAASKGDNDELVRAWEHTVDLARAMSHDPTLISHLVGISVSALACEELGRIMVEFDLDEATSRRLLAILDERPVLAPLPAVLERERITQYDTIQRTHSDDGRGDGILLVGRLEQLGAVQGLGGPGLSAQHPIYNVAGLVLPRRAETTRALDEYFDAAKKQAEMPRVQRRQHAVDLDALVDTLPRFQILLRTTLPAIDRAIQNDDSGRAIIDATRVLLAIEAFEAGRGQLPSTLDELSPECLEDLPVDPVSCQPFVYSRREASADDPRQFWLYSVGNDQVDNGGAEFTTSRHAETRALQDSQEAWGFDYIFNRLRKPYSDEQEIEEPDAAINGGEVRETVPSAEIPDNP